MSLTIHANSGPVRTTRTISAAAMRRALVSGARKVIADREGLNRINVFPVADGDTGSNLAFTLNTVLGGPLARPQPHAGSLMLAVGEHALDGARGNSGAILAQFLQGVAETVSGESRLAPARLAEAVGAGSRAARAALSQPQEGTILSVIQAFADALDVRGSNRGGRFRSAADLVRAGFVACAAGAGPHPAAIGGARARRCRGCRGQGIRRPARGHR
ncbi:DAK2 domain-containing protein [Alkalisalibacterium limincola]|uniref:DAK2 domain-containing protein n=1 Tax=Alkalisalibacterium limincola TaxID=2699169 RepID=A0A5C8KHA8_9GAMM|nr:DAK2 domain-containing protein [Alkalisalibacterium limincola]TXK59830.1 DAK2 domain-containing protein [Alkalisalibacterium limincola]